MPVDEDQMAKWISANTLEVAATGAVGRRHGTLLRPIDLDAVELGESE